MISIHLRDQRPTQSYIGKREEEEPGIIMGPGVKVTYSLEPATNPNHLVITVPPANLPNLNEDTQYVQIKPDPNRRIVNAYMLWWEDH